MFNQSIKDRVESFHKDLRPLIINIYREVYPQSTVVSQLNESRSDNIYLTEDYTRAISDAVREVLIAANVDLNYLQSITDMAIRFFIYHGTSNLAIQAVYQKCCLEKC